MSQPYGDPTTIVYYTVMLSNWFINTQVHTYVSAAPSLQRSSEQRTEVNVDTLT